MACGKGLKSLGRKCNDGCKGSACSEENIAYFTSQEFMNKILANMTINGLNTHDKSLLGAIEEIDNLMASKQDHTTQLDHIRTLSIGDINNMILAGSMLP